MRNLVSQTNVDAADLTYPKGRTRDKVGVTPGTILTEGLLGDFIQFFQKLTIDANIVENELPDNTANGFQLIEALDDRWRILKKITANFGVAATGNITFAAYRMYAATINNASFEFTITSIPENTINYIYINKGVNDVVSFSGVTGTIDSIQLGKPVLIFAIENINGSIIATQLNRQFSGSLSQPDFVSGVGSITTFGYFNYMINDNVCTVETSFTFTITGSVSTITINISGFGINKYNTTSPGNIRVLSGTTLIPATIDFTDTTMVIRLNAATSGAITVIANSSFRVK